MHENDSGIRDNNKFCNLFPFWSAVFPYWVRIQIGHACNEIKRNMDSLCNLEKAKEKEEEALLSERE